MMTTTTSRKPDKFDNMISKYKAKGLNVVADFLLNKARSSKRTAAAYSFALGHLNNYVEKNYTGYNIQTILEPLLANEKQKHNIDIYKLLDGFVSYLQNDTINGHDLSAGSIKMYMAAIKSYLLFNDLEISPAKFKNRITMPHGYHELEEPLDPNDIRKILTYCSNRRLRAYILVLASGGMRAVEALAIRLRDIDFSFSPTEIHIRKEYSKTKTERFAYISDEATEHLKGWIDWKYRGERDKKRSNDDLVFSMKLRTSKEPLALYNKMCVVEFHKALEAAGLTDRKEDGVLKRHKITIHSFRRFVKTTIANQASTDYSEWFLGHKQSPYYTVKHEERRRIYKEKCMKYLTFLDYPTLEATGQSFEAKLKEKDQEISQLRQHVEQLKRQDTGNTERMANLEARLEQVYDIVLGKERKQPLSSEQYNTLLKQGLIDAGKSDKEAEYLIRTREIERQKKKSTR